jgi:hypothetical protein
MILVRNTMRAKFGKGEELAKMMVAAMQQMVSEMESGSHFRVLTGLSGATDTVTIEIEEASLAAWEQRQAQLTSQPGYQQFVDATAALVEGTGSNEFYTIAGEG